MATWPKDNQASRNAFYGDPGKGQIASQMVPVVPPFNMYYTDDNGKVSRVKAVQFHKKCAPALAAALNEIWDYCQHDQKKVDASGASKYFGAYNHRLVRGSNTKWSNHAYAAAIDLNAIENSLGKKKGTMPDFIVDAFCRQGAMWGGWYNSRPDWMHFEFVDNGGRKPKSAKPVYPPALPSFLLPQPDAPVDELEDHDAPATPVTPTPIMADAMVTGDPELYSVQKRLKQRKYSPGLLDGIWGSGTSGALGGFINDRGGKIASPTSLDAFNAVKEDIKAELGRAESENWFRPVSADRANADAKTVATLAPAVVPAKQNYLITLWGSITAAAAAIWTQISDSVSKAWDWYTDNSDSGIVSWVSHKAGEIPVGVWLLAAAAAIGWVALNSRASVNKITESVRTGELQ